jgi:tryptophan synthase alpha chain
MNRIDRIFAQRREAGQKTLMPFMTAGDPDLETTAALLPALEQAGASIVELGIPFSDPIADGPVIEASMTRALGSGVGLSRVLEMVAEARKQVDLGLVAMVSYSIVHRWGLERFVRRAGEAGIDGFIFPDLPLEEAGAGQEVTRGAGRTLSLLSAPTTPLERARRIAAASSGFVYVVSRPGTTGEQTELPAGFPERVASLREVTDLPMAVGFGIASQAHVRQVVEVADAAIVGSALVRRIDQARDQGREAIVSSVSELTRDLAAGLTGPTQPMGA